MSSWQRQLLNLQTRLDEVDTLLENIQEKEWAEEEEDDKEEWPHGLNDTEEATNNSQEMTLLDQILAMIIGAPPIVYSNARTDEEHYLFIKEEHQSILNEWKDTFGTLPKVPGASDTKKMSVEEVRAMGNDCKIWMRGWIGRVVDGLITGTGKVLRIKHCCVVSIDTTLIITSNFFSDVAITL